MAESKKMDAAEDWRDQSGFQWIRPTFADYKMVHNSMRQFLTWDTVCFLDPYPYVLISLGTVARNACGDNVALIRPAATRNRDHMIPRRCAFPTVGAATIKLAQNHLLNIGGNWINISFTRMCMLSSLRSKVRICSIPSASKTIGDLSPANADGARNFLHIEHLRSPFSPRSINRGLLGPPLRICAEYNMANKTGIEWTDATWNPIRGCTRESEGCRNCYAEAIAARFSDQGQPFHGIAERTKSGPRWTGKVALVEERLALPLRWRKPARIFVNSMFDLFHESVPDEWIDRVFAVMSLAPQHTFQVLTKRAERMRKYFDRMRFEACGEDGAWAPRRLDQHACDITNSPCAAGYMEDVPWPLKNCWLGVSVEDQARADERIPHLLATPAAVRFLSCEPLLSDIDLTRLPIRRAFGSAFLNALTGRSETHYGDPLQHKAKLDLCIVGGESGPHARPMHPDWPRSLRDQCQVAGIAFFMKQMARKAAIPSDLAIREFPDGA